MSGHRTARVLVYTHRWLGIVSGVLFVVWFVSGIVMMYARMPELDPGERIDRLAPVEVPALRIEHMEIPSPYTEFGVKGIGEGGAIAPPATITNAINDALRPLGAAEILQSPATPRRILEAIEQAQQRSENVIEKRNPWIPAFAGKTGVKDTSP